MRFQGVSRRLKKFKGVLDRFRVFQEVGGGFRDVSRPKMENVAEFLEKKCHVIFQFPIRNGDKLWKINSAVDKHFLLETGKFANNHMTFL